ncbi:MAG: hypothetical protein V3T17_18960 [Pseudomonadales bacterium]
MLSNHIANLQSNIQWAQYQDDIDILHLARDSMNRLMAFVSTLPDTDQQQAYQHIDQVLPMEWPLWMEACRYEDSMSGTNQEMTLH